jgi:hypothetical protein
MTTRLLSLLLLVGMGLLVGCRENPLPFPFQLVQTHEIVLAETDHLEVNNCGNILTRPYVQWYNDPLDTAGVSYLIPNGGEPFSSSVTA